jgi:O-antigen/teichoic acid export membrane protein
MMRRFASNALANLAAGISGTFYQVGLTAIASRSFDPRDFAAWSLAVSLSALVPLFSISLSTIVTRQLVELPQLQHPILLTAARRIASCLGLIAFVAIILIALGMQYASQPARAFGGAAFCLLVALLVLSQIWQVVSQPSFGWFYAHEQNWRAARGNGTVVLAHLWKPRARRTVCGRRCHCGPRGWGSSTTAE